LKARKTNIVAGTVFGVHPFNGETNFRGGTIDGGRSKTDPLPVEK